MTVRDRVGAERDGGEGSSAEKLRGGTVVIGDVDMAPRTHSEEAEEKEMMIVDDDGDKAEEHTRDEMEMEGWIEDNSNKSNMDDKDNNVRKKLKGGVAGNERDKNDYDSDDVEDLQTIERSTQRCIEAAYATMVIIRNFDDTQTKYHGGHYTFTVYLAGTILIMHLSITEDLAMQTQIHEELEICFRFLSILTPYWKDADEKAKALRDLLSIHANKNKQQGDFDDEEDDNDDEDYDEDGDKDNDSGGGGIEGEEEDDDYSADDDSGAEQSLQDLIIADALLDLSNQLPKDDYDHLKIDAHIIFVFTATVNVVTATRTPAAIKALAFRIIALGVSTPRN
ncbi:hypothetical protein BGZ96_003671 [Linnemannia gamsii]|uniref:Uncharacterized protein n=1 Tax=Linnemannia gamsii TaxID=64522 RepID=A0ABQ7JJ05_9FUNG|nr:hypothetical protein BGZ96_003671 [Linnemannia gamsii]